MKKEASEYEYDGDDSEHRAGQNQPLTTAYLHEIFRNLESGDRKGFFDHIANDVDWIVEGTHPLAGHYRSKADFFTYL
jgi:ketosteroid isomerase-like protein